MSTKNELKIFVDGYLLNKEHQGTKTYIRELYKEFAKENSDVLIFIGCFKDLEVEKEFSDFKNIQFIYFKQSSRILRMFFEIPKIISTYQFQYAHFQYVIPFVKSKSCKYIVTIHDILFNDFKQYFSSSYRLKRNLLFKYSAKKADFLLTVSKYSKDRIKEYYKLQFKDIFITPNGVNSEYFKEYNKQEAIDYISKKFSIKNYLLYVSRIEPRKNQQALLKVFLELENKEIQLVFIGVKSLDNKQFDEQLKELTAEQSSKIHILQDISDEDLLFFYKGAKAFVYPTLAEGFGIPPLEAAALKIPVLSSNKTAMKDFQFLAPNLIDIHNFDVFKNRLNIILEKKDAHHLDQVQNYIQLHYNWKKSSDIITDIIKNNTL
ncbi:glycosyltransferase family 4 protein [Polaribacter sp. MSW13]|uniref:Glycosyltransferase family 4 protein n=1 Tax=Polaribacter marinus TaxID=2916838 RepID=A0A9X1VM58_9FLAO|nr:glycosyltransferase family 1 protein [Polaribacter marinus]MCI2228620.1 glycosyltransferase family 4 protein [Polaribacter marinus]